MPIRMSDIQEQLAQMTAVSMGRDVDDYLKAKGVILESRDIQIITALVRVVALATTTHALALHPTAMRSTVEELRRAMEGEPGSGIVMPGKQ